MSTNAEIWKAIPSAPGWLASNIGRLRKPPHSLPMPNGGTKRAEVAPTYGHFDAKKNRFKLSVNGKTLWVAPLICEAFNGRPARAGLECMHLDEDSHNNAPSNLAWGTRVENQRAPKLQAQRRLRTEFLHHLCKLSNEQIAAIRRLRNVKPAREVAIQFGTTHHYVHQIWANRARPEVKVV